MLCFWTKSKKQNNNKIKSQTKTPPPESEIEPGPLANKRGCVTTAPPSQLRESIVVKLFYCFEAMGRNVNKQ